MLAKTRRAEQQVQKETLQQLDVFRKRKEDAERKALEEANAGSAEVKEEEKVVWVAGKKRKKEGHAGLLKGVKLRRGSTADDKKEGKKSEGVEKSAEGTSTAKGEETKPPGAPEPIVPPKPTALAPSRPQPPAPLALSLGYASSDED